MAMATGSRSNQVTVRADKIANSFGKYAVDRLPEMIFASLISFNTLFDRLPNWKKVQGISIVP
jgi:hypothetical protein